MDRRRLAIAIVVAGVFALGLGWSSAPASEPSVAPPLVPTPMQSLAARRALVPQPSAPESEVPPARVAVRTAIVVVRLRDAHNGFLSYPRTARLDPSAFWPLPGDAPFPEGETAPLLQEVIADPERVEDFLLAAEDEGMTADLVPLDDPWAVLLALEAERRFALAEYEADYADALAQLPPGTLVAAKKLFGPPPLGLAADLADLVVVEHPDHPATEYARLILLDALQAIDAPAEEARALALDMLRNTDDGLVVGQAMSLLSRGPRGEALEGSDLDALVELFDDYPEAMEGLDVASFALDHALRRDDGPRARQWLERFEDAIARACPVDSEAPRCALHRNNRDEVVAYVGDVAPEDATDWRQAMEIAGYLCTRDEDGWRQVTHEVVANWDDGWTWEAWSPSAGAYTACVEAAVARGPEPEAPVSVRLTVAHS